LIIAELLVAIRCCRIAKLKKHGEKLSYLIIAERTSAKFLKLHSQGRITESKSVRGMMALLEDALGGTAEIYSAGSL